MGARWRRGDRRDHVWPAGGDFAPVGENRPNKFRKGSPQERCLDGVALKDRKNRLGGGDFQSETERTEGGSADPEMSQGVRTFRSEDSSCAFDLHASAGTNRIGGPADGQEGSARRQFSESRDHVSSEGTFQGGSHLAG